jgi:hypothetical protein
MESSFSTLFTQHKMKQGYEQEEYGCCRICMAVAFLLCLSCYRNTWLLQAYEAHGSAVHAHYSHPAVIWLIVTGARAELLCLRGASTLRYLLVCRTRSECTRPELSLITVPL